jgi:hypothetical protein
MKKSINAYICTNSLGSNMRHIGTFSTVREAKAAARAAYKAGEPAANNIPAGAYAWQNAKGHMCYSWK